MSPKGANSFGVLQWRTPVPTQVILERGIVSNSNLLSSLLQQHRSSQHALVTDDHVYPLYGEELLDRLRTAGLAVSDYVIPSNESSKCIDNFLTIVNRMLQNGIEKNSRVIALGGGVVANLAGFIASTLYRGLSLIQIPTSLMAQLDAAIDDKHAVNHSFGKNLIGSHYPPEVVIIDTTLLRSLPVRHLRNGIAEAIKHAFTQSTHLFNLLSDSRNRVNDIDVLEPIVVETARLKVNLLNSVIDDNLPYVELLLQYGHCIGHALEAVTDYRLLHGEAIAIGMCVTAEIARLSGLCSESVVRQHYRLLDAYGLPTAIPKEVTVEALMKFISHDKYRVGCEVRLAILEDIGQLHWSRQGPFIALNFAAIFEMLCHLKSQGCNYPP